MCMPHLRQHVHDLVDATRRLGQADKRRFEHPREPPTHGTALGRNDEADGIYTALLRDHGDDTGLLSDIANLAIEEGDLPSADAKLDILQYTIEYLSDSGYVYIGMDHFALPTDSLYKAMKEHKLHRNFMGYTVMPASDQIGIGMTSIGDVGGAYAANQRNLARPPTASDRIAITPSLAPSG